jgi:hypothetical protein
MRGRNNSNHNPKGWGDPRLLIAMVVTGLSIIGILYLSWEVLHSSIDAKETYQYVFSTVIPLLGTWIGTVLAFYFSRENLESASKSVQDIVAQLNPEERLRSISVTSKMIPTKQMILLKVTDGKLENINLVNDMLRKLDACGKNRLPVLDKDDKPLYMIHRSIIDRYLAVKSIEIANGNNTPTNGTDGKSMPESGESVSTAESTKPPKFLKDLTLKDILDDDTDAKNLFEKSFAVISENTNLADAKAAMDKIENCSDVFVTKTGSKSEPVIGWLTNLMITENAKV